MAKAMNRNRKIQAPRRRARLAERARRSRGGMEIRASLVRAFGRIRRDLGKLVASWR